MVKVYHKTTLSGKKPPSCLASIHKVLGIRTSQINFSKMALASPKIFSDVPKLAKHSTTSVVAHWKAFHQVSLPLFTKEPDGITTR